ncbi:peptidoglycan DD-metalloendopeptidase family protein [Streptomyces sp. NPDC093595]|uniref:peptidoglycan DD-metalloendopeptidase family protein n=1 Tax=Streptomyces sp. NPDC093595 TaxID=3366045 RepID=UPI0037F604F8
MRLITLLLALAVALPAVRAADPPGPPAPPRPGPAGTTSARPADPGTPAEGGGGSGGGAAVGAASGTWPLGPPRPAVVRGWEPPASPYGPGHRGVDLAAPAGAPVRAAAAGRVSFAGPVAGRGVVTVTHPGPGPALRTSYEPLQPLVAVGTEVAAGQVVGRLTAELPHCAPTCLHWSLRRGTVYLNPLSLLPAHLLGRRPSRLLPVGGAQDQDGGEHAEGAGAPRGSRAAGSRRRGGQVPWTP